MEKSPSLSPDGRWVAFVSNRSGRDKVYVTSFPEPRRFIPVSPQGGMAPVWSPSTDQPELFFQLGDTLMVVKATGNGTLSFSRPEEVLSGAYRWNSSVDTPRSYDVLPNGQSFLFLKPFVAGNDREIRVVQNWMEELKAKVPIAR